MKAAEKFVLKRWSAMLKANEVRPRDPKSTLQEWVQAQGLPTPSYRHDAREGPDHAPVFTATVHVQGREPAIGAGPSKQDAEREAAKAMLALIGGHS
jgi:ribonuclease III